jgi:hypothetical protein
MALSNGGTGNSREGRIMIKSSQGASPDSDRRGDLGDAMGLPTIITKTGVTFLPFS